MSNTRRPTLAAKESRAEKAKRDEALDSGIRLTVEGRTYEARMGDVTPAIARELRARCGFGFVRLVAIVAAEPDIDVVSAFVWVARRIAGEQVDLDDVNVTYHALLSDGFDIAVAGEVEPDPEA